ncbi:MAG: phospholipase [Chloroflexi bacterium]|nr:phospholipase [Chloroflexota bacterium]MBV9600589.1 phospholipase [Chloroflexota bacterium]
MSHTHHHPSYWTRRHTESVVLDIGDDVGALILYTSADHHTHEIEVSLLDAEGDARRVHSAVLERSLNGHTFYAATYPELPAGEYQVWCEGSPRVSVAAGAVAELRI